MDKMCSVNGLVLTLLTLTVTLTAAGKNRPNKQDKKAGLPGARTKAEAIHMDYAEGSGDDLFGSDVRASGDGNTMMSECYKHQMAARERKLSNIYIPQCTENGNFDSRQCHKARNQCWCVDSRGTEIQGSRKRENEKISCPWVPAPGQDKPLIRVTSRIPKINQPTVRPTSSFIQKGDDVVIVDSKNKFNSAESSVDIDFMHHDNDLDSSGSRHMSSSVFGKPGVLAVIIGGAVVGLLFAVTLVMFIVYRMRKKDEGSYALDEPKASPTVGYTKTRDREFFA